MARKKHNTDFGAAAMMKRMREFCNSWRPPQPPEPGWLVGVDHDGTDLVIPYKDLFESHVHCLGPSGFGKTYLLYSLAAQTILASHGAIIIDPDGGLYSMLLNFLFQQQVDPSRVVLINTQAPDWTVRMNPLQSWGGQVGAGTDVAAGALLLAAGDPNFDGMPRLRRYVRASCRALEEKQKPLALLPWMLAMLQASVALRNETTQGVANDYTKLIWQNLQEMNRRDMLEHLDSTQNRVSAFAEEPRLCQMMTYSEGNIDWQKVLDDQMIVLINLGQDGRQPLAHQDLQLLGGLVMHGIIQAAYRRPLEQSKHCFVFADEYGEYVSEDVAQGLARLRKREVHLVLCHQTISQIEVESPKLWSSVDNNCQVKLLFGGLGRDDAERMAKTLYTGEVHGDNIKYEQQTVAFRPVIKWEEIVSSGFGGAHTVMEGSSHSTTRSSGGSVGRTQTSGVGETVFYTQDGITLFGDNVSRTTSFSEAVSEASSWSESHGYSSSSSEAHTSSWSTSSTRVPVTYHEDFLQPPSITFYSLEEEWENIYARLMNLPKRVCVVKVGNRPAVAVPTLAIEEHIAHRDQLAEYENQVFQCCQFAVRSIDAAAIFSATLAASGFTEHTTRAIAASDFSNVGLIAGLPPIASTEPAKKKRAS